MAAQFLEDGVGQRLTRGVPTAGAEVVLRRVDLDVVGDERRLEGAQRLARDLGTDAVAGDDCELDGVRVCAMDEDMGEEPKRRVSVAGLAAVVTAVQCFLHGVARSALALGHYGAPSASRISGGPAPVPRGGEPAL